MKIKISKKKKRVLDLIIKQQELLDKMSYDKQKAEIEELLDLAGEVKCQILSF